MANNKPQMPPRARVAAAGRYRISAPIRRALAGIALISGVVNILALTAPLFMLQVYDRVLASHSIPTLVGLAVLAAGLYAFQSILDILRSRVLLRLGERFDHYVSGHVHAAVTRLPLHARMPGDGLQPLRDLDNVRSFLSSQGPTAFFDLPWMPLYLSICFLFHFWIGMTALVGALVLVSLTLVTDLLSRAPAREATLHGMARHASMESGRRNAEVIRAMGLGERVAARWHAVNLQYLAANRRAGDIAGGLGGASRSLRMMLQSAILGVGAWLVIEQQTTAGVMIASSIMMSRALAPVDLAIGSWRPFLMARQSWARLKELLEGMPLLHTATALPRPERELGVERLSVMPPGERRPTVGGVAFRIAAGSALAIVGASGSGKSTLARALVGVWQPASGKVRLDGASLDQWDNEALGRHIGYLPQGVELFEGTIADNIARFEPGADARDIIAAAKAAGVHDLILRFESGYDTQIGESGSALSAGQRQRIGLARALYRDPFLVVLDEPNANLDGEGEAAVAEAIASVRRRGGIAAVILHRPSAIAAVDFILVMENGRMKTFGPRDEVLPQLLNGPRRGGVPARQAGGMTSGRAMAPFHVVTGSATASGGKQSAVSDREESNAE